jgi:7,8-dihydropterin-6-yl-methyl-4-(beta-D-ribofuranosyl)aminobenzene 5'-phosphate synthase
VEVEDTTKILFDTGMSGSVLLNNMEKLNIDPKGINCVFISHNHWDHTGGLKGFLKLNNNVKLYLPYSFFSFTKPRAREVIRVKDSVKIYENVFSTGQLNNIEQSMVVKTGRGLVVIAGCSHPGVGNILNSARQFGKVIVLIGGLHGFSDFDLVKDLDLICATHCTQYKDRIKNLYPEKFLEGGAGREIEI